MAIVAGPTIGAVDELHQLGIHSGAAGAFDFFADSLGVIFGSASWLGWGLDQEQIS